MGHHSGSLLIDWPTCDDGKEDELLPANDRKK